MKDVSRFRAIKIPLLLMALILVIGVVVGCGGSDETSSADTPAAAQAAAPAAKAEAPTEVPKSKDLTDIRSTPVVKPTVAPAKATVAKDSMLIVINQEPTEPDPWFSTTDYPNKIIHNISQPMSFLAPDFVDTKTAGIAGWEMRENGKTWILSLNEGMEFHNGEVWNAEAAKYTIDYMGQCIKCGNYTQVGASHGEVIDDYTVAWHIDLGHPALPRFAQYTIFRAPEYHRTTPQETQADTGIVYGWGPYKFGEWIRGEKYTIERFDGYNSDPTSFMTQAGTVNTAEFVWRAEETVRSAMIRAGEADLAWAMAGDTAEELENSDHGSWVKIVSGEVNTIDVDTIWHPELKKLKVRQALTHAIDCEELALALFGPTSRCSSGPNGIPGTLGVTEKNWKPRYPYDPVRAKELLAEADYNPDNVIDYWTRNGRYAKDVELSESLGVFWEAVGINVNINVVEGSIWSKYHKAGPSILYKEAIDDLGMSHVEAVKYVHDGDPPADPGVSPGLVYFAPGGEYFDFGRQINFYMSCLSFRSSNCDEDSHELGQRALAAGGEERRELMEQVYDVFSERLYQIPIMEIVSVWGVNKDLDYTNMPGGRRILVNTAHFK